jgi:hypothetical protein
MQTKNIRQNTNDVLQRLADLFRVDQEMIVRLSRKSRHPLPLPSAPPAPHDPELFPPAYLSALRRWVRQEAKAPPRRQLAGLDLRFIQEAVRVLEKNSPKYDFIRHFPPGYFIG